MVHPANTLLLESHKSFFLSLQTGDKIVVISRVDADWVVGELYGKNGMFPASFVDKVPENLPQESSGDKADTESPSNSSGSGQLTSQPSAKVEVGTE